MPKKRQGNSDRTAAEPCVRLHADGIAAISMPNLKHQPEHVEVKVPAGATVDDNGKRDMEVEASPCSSGLVRGMDEAERSKSGRDGVAGNVSPFTCAPDGDVRRPRGNQVRAEGGAGGQQAVSLPPGTIREIQAWAERPAFNGKRVQIQNPAGFGLGGHVKLYDGVTEDLAEFVTVPAPHLRPPADEAPWTGLT